MLIVSIDDDAMLTEVLKLPERKEDGETVKEERELFKQMRDKRKQQ